MFTAGDQDHLETNRRPVFRSRDHSGLIVGEGSSYHFATGYFNLTERFMRDITETRSTYSLLMAHPEANGFLGARFPIGGTSL